MSDEEILAWVHGDYDRTLILKALDGTAFRSIWRTAKLIKQFNQIIDPAKLSPNLSGLHQRGLITSKMVYNNGKLRTIYIKGQSRTFADSSKGWKLTPKGAGILWTLTKS